MPQSPTAQPPTRTSWILAPAAVGEVVLGPGLRILAQARALRALGHEVHLGMLSCTAELPEGITFHPLETSLLRSIRPGDGVIVQPSLRIRWIWELLRRRIPFHADFYNILSIETLETFPLAYPARAIPSLRRKMTCRESIVARLARKIYVSHPLQTAFLAGLMADDPGDAAARLPARCLELPMGLPSTPMPTGNPFPYPAVLEGRQIFLWGGGIWSWMDPTPLLEAFVELERRGSSAALFFLAGANHSPSKSEDASIARAHAAASRLGALGRNVFFNDRKAGPADLPSYLEHCAAGILSNSPNLESTMSWRTRQLDLLWAGRPALVAGADPLSNSMSLRGAALQCELTASAIADAIERLAADPALRTQMGAAGMAMGRDMTWPRVLAPFTSLHADPQAFLGSGPALPVRLALRYLMG